MFRPDLDINANMAILHSYLPVLTRAVRSGFAKYQDPNHYSALAKAAHDNAAAAKNVHRHILEEIEMEVSDLNGLVMVNARNLMVLNIQDKVLLRFKKMDEEGYSSSYQTEQQRNFDRQLPLPYLPPAATRLTFGYEPDLAFSTIVRVLTACALGNRTHWCAQVNEEEAGAVSWVDITPKRISGTEPFLHYGMGDV